MPTIIDSLIIELSLDASGFNKGQKDAVDSLRKLEGDAGKHVKGAQTGFDGLLNTFKEVQGRLLAIGALIAAGLGFNKLIQDTTQLNSQLGYLSTSLGVSAKELSKWETAGKTIGASANEMASAFQSIQDALSGQQVEGGQKLTAFSYMTHQKGQGPAVDLIGPDGKKRSPSDILMDMSRWAEAQQDKSVASYILRNTAGMNQGMTNMLMLGPKELEKRLKQNEQFAPSEEQIKKFQALQEAFGNLLSVMDKLEGLIAAHLAPTLTKILNLITDFLTKIGLGENPGDVAGSTAAKHGFSELAPNPTKPSLAARAWNWLTGKSTDPGPRGAAGSGNDEGANYTPGANRQFVGISRGGLTRGDRNNNPGNMKFGPLAQAFGATGSDDKGFAIFPNRLSGDAAHEALIKSNAYRGLTLDQFGDKYSEGNPSWKKTVGSALGIGNSDIVNVDDPRLMGAIRKAEGTDRATAQPVAAKGAVDPNQSDRPSYMGGTGKMEGYGKFNWGSGGAGYESIPYGTYPITPGTIGPWGSSHGALGVNNNSIYDPKLGRSREGIEIHASSSEDLDRLYTEGCFAVPRAQWPSFKQGLLDQIHKKGTMYLKVGPNGAEISHSKFGIGGARKNFGMMLGARASLATGNSSTTTNTSSSATHIHEMNVTTPHNADPAAYARGIQQELGRYDNVQNAVTGLQ